MFKKKNLSSVILGTQWGDEGKGKLIDSLSSFFDLIVRFNGGANAGHTIYVNGEKYVFHLIPSGLLHKKTIGVIGNGTVININDFVEEIEKLTKNDVTILKRIKISERAHLIFDYHKKLDLEIEKNKGNKKLGTTGKGIGPVISDKVLRIGIRCGDLFDEENLKEKLKKNCEFHNKMFNLNLNYKEEFSKIEKNIEKLKPLICDTRVFLNKKIAEGNKLLFEGAQAYNLDIDHGTYPYVTSTSVSIGGLFTGIGISPKKIDEIIGITKAYTTRVGEGPFPTELKGEMLEILQKKGGEFGATTGRPRRCGWFDSVIVKNCVETNGIDYINLTKLDILSGIKELKIAEKYFLNGDEIFDIPVIQKNIDKLEVKYITIPGWDEDISKIKKFEDLPENAQKYVNKIEELINCKVKIIGVGIDRDDLIFRE